MWRILNVSPDVADQRYHRTSYGKRNDYHDWREVRRTWRQVRTPQPTVAANAWSYAANSYATIASAPINSKNNTMMPYGGVGTDMASTLNANAGVWLRLAKLPKPTLHLVDHYNREHEQHSKHNHWNANDIQVVPTARRRKLDD
jgi:hypothetical protein